MTERLAFCVIMLCMTMLCKDFLIESYNGFYRFEIEKTVKTTGVLTKAFLSEGIGTGEYQCDVLFYHNGIAYNFSDDIALWANMNYKKGDSIDVLFNKRNPHWATINNSQNRYFLLFCNLFLVASSVYSIIFLSKTIFLFIRKRTAKG